MYLGIKKVRTSIVYVIAIFIKLPWRLGFLTKSLVDNNTNTGVLRLIRNRYRNELFPLLIFIGIGAMIDFGPVLQNPFMLFGAAAQFGIFLRSL